MCRLLLAGISHVVVIAVELIRIGSLGTVVGPVRDAVAVDVRVARIPERVAVEIGLLEYDRDAIHQFVLTRAADEDVFRTLATESVEDRRFNPGLEPARADIIVGGLCVLVGIFRYFGFDECVVSESDILDGLILSQIR